MVGDRVSRPRPRWWCIAIAMPIVFVCIVLRLSASGTQWSSLSLRPGMVLLSGLMAEWRPAIDIYVQRSLHYTLGVALAARWREIYRRVQGTYHLTDESFDFRELWTGIVGATQLITAVHTTLQDSGKLRPLSSNTCRANEMCCTSLTIVARFRLCACLVAAAIDEDFHFRIYLNTYMYMHVTYMKSNIYNWINIWSYIHTYAMKMFWTTSIRATQMISYT